MLTGIQDVYVNVADMDRARAFYRDLLGFAETETSPYWTALNCGGLRLGLHWTGGDPVPPMPHDTHGPHAGAVVTLRSTDLEADVALLTAQGVEFLGPAIHEAWGSLVVFRDPDGNILKLMQPPGA